MSENYLKKWKDESKIKNITLARIMGISTRQIARIFNGHSLPSWRLLLLIRRMTGLSWDKILQSLLNENRVALLNIQNKKRTKIKSQTDQVDLFSTVEGRIHALNDVFECMKNDYAIYPYPRA